MTWRSIRFRLTAWYFAALASALILVGAGAWFGMRASLYDAVDDELRTRVEGVRNFMNEEGASLSPHEVEEEFREQSELGPGGELFRIGDARGTWLYQSSGLKDGLPIPSLAKVDSRPVFEDARIQSTRVRLVSQVILVDGTPYLVQVAAPMNSVYDSLARFRSLLWFCLPAVLLAATGGGYWLSRRALVPVDEITRAARSISIGNLSERLWVPRTGDELQRLSETLNAMLASLENSIRRITQFTTDASHELRAPLAIIRTTAELSLRRERSEAEYREALREILVEAERTSELVESLLLLARADSGTDNLRLVPVDAVEAFREAIAQGEKLGAAKQVQIEAALPNEPIEIQGDALALRRLFLILIDNAVKYTPSGGKVNVEIQRTDGLLTGTVRDTGIGISQEDLPHIFDRFWRADKVRSREAGGVGLGLAIARWIAERHGGKIVAQSRTGEGSTFQVRIPILSGNRLLTAADRKECGTSCDPRI